MNDAEGTYRGTRCIRIRASTKLIDARILKASVADPIEKQERDRSVCKLTQIDDYSLKPPDMACAKQASKVSSSMTGWPLSLQTIFRASFSRSWWLAIATRFSKDAIARLGVNRMPSMSDLSPGVCGMLGGDCVPLLLLPAPLGSGTRSAIGYGKERF